MDNLDSVYTDLIMEHSMASHNKRKLEHPDKCEMGHNPSCGDEIELEIKMNGDVIEDLAFTGHGCAISQASTSIMIDTLIGKTKKEALEIISIYQLFSIGDYDIHHSHLFFFSKVNSFRCDRIRRKKWFLVQ